MADAAVEKPTEAHKECEKDVANGKEANGVTAKACTAAESSPTKLKEKLASPAKHRLEEEEDKPDKDADFPCNGKADSGHETKRMKKGAAEPDKKEAAEGDDDEDDEEHDEDDDEDDDEDYGEEGEEADEAEDASE
jgi:hypothetical protein